MAETKGKPIAFHDQPHDPEAITAFPVSLPTMGPNTQPLLQATSSGSASGAVTTPRPFPKSSGATSLPGNSSEPPRAIWMTRGPPLQSIVQASSSGSELFLDVASHLSISCYGRHVSFLALLRRGKILVSRLTSTTPKSLQHQNWEAWQGGLKL